MSSIDRLPCYGVYVARKNRIVFVEGVITIPALSDDIVGERHIGDGIAVELTVGVDGVAAAAEIIVVNRDVVNGSEIVVDHDRICLILLVDDRVVLNIQRKIRRAAAVVLNAVVVRAGARVKIVKITVFNQDSSVANGDRTADVMDVDAVDGDLRIILDKDAVGSFLPGSSRPIDLAIFDDNVR